MLETGNTSGAEVAAQGGDEGGIQTAVMDAGCASLGCVCGKCMVVECGVGCRQRIECAGRCRGRTVKFGDDNS